MDKKCIISVIIPAFNVQDYLGETIDSVIGQTIGLENMQIVLINNGSEDKTGQVCEKYADQYPDNIEYISLDEMDLGKARNEGIKRMRGDYATILTADDQWSPNGLEKACAFLEEHKDEIDAAACRINCYGITIDKHHYLDYKFSKDRIVDITEDAKVPQLFCSSMVVRADALREIDFRHIPSKKEEMVFAAELLFRQKKYGLLRSAEYRYRLRSDKFSTVDDPIVTLRDVYGEVFRLSKETFGEIIPYAQYMVAGELRSTMYDKTFPADMSSEKRAEFDRLAHDLWDEISEECILSLRKVSYLEKTYCLKYKLGEGFDPTDLSKLVNVSIRLMHIRGDELYIGGTSVLEMLGEDYEIYITDKNGKKYEIDRTYNHNYNIRFMDGGVALKGLLYDVKLPLKGGNRYQFVIRNKKTGEERNPKMTLGRFSCVQEPKGSYHETDKYIMYREGTQLVVRKNRRSTKKALKEEFDRFLHSKGLDDIAALRDRADQLKKGKPIWIITDRVAKAGDNGEALFRYLMSVKADRKYRIFYAISKECEDYQRMQQYGKVLDYGSDEYIAYFLAADRYISSHWTLNRNSVTSPDPFGENNKYFRDRITWKYVFLQHGITINDQSKQGNKHLKNVDLLITAANDEYRSFLREEYGYESNEIVCAGFPRYDLLENRAQKVIAFMPTWRRGLSKVYDETFMRSDFYRFFSSLMEDARLQEVMKKKGYRGVLYLHPYFVELGLSRCFHGNEVFSIEPGAFDYNKVFAESALMVTDYSSVNMDFAYLKKPLIYAQFDEDDFFEDHTCSRGFFSYREDGFGKVCTDLDSTIEELVRIIENDCVMDPMYVERVDKFFAYRDKGNGERVYRAIENM